MHVRIFWQVCVARDGIWDNLASCDTRAEAESELRAMRSTFPRAFLVRMTLTRVDAARPLPQLTVV